MRHVCRRRLPCPIGVQGVSQQRVAADHGMLSGPVDPSSSVGVPDKEEGVTGGAEHWRGTCRRVHWTGVLTVHGAA